MPTKGANSLGLEEHRPPPASALLLHFQKSDGDSSIRPPSTNGPTRDSSGRWNYYRKVPLDEKTSTEWRRKIGSKVAEMLGYKNADAYYVADWPSGYAFYDHNKEMGEGEMRHDAYLYGSLHTAKFRSTNEFIPHAYWLMTTATLDNSECACKYCSKKKRQTEVNETVLGAPSKIATTRTNAIKPPPLGKPRRSRGKGKEKSKDDLESDSIPTSIQSRPSRKGAKKKIISPTLPLNFDDVPPPGAYTARRRFTEIHGGRLVRDGELIWFPLPTPIYHSTEPQIAIKWWPAFAEDIEHRKQVTRNEDTSFTVKEIVYVVTRPLMSGTTVVKVSESSVLPWGAWEVDQALVDVIKQTSFSSDLGLASESAVFDPRGCSGELTPGVSFQRAAPYFAMAVQTASHMDLYWSPMFQVGGGPSRGRSASFQGLWFGAERIWRDDVIRVLPSHKELLSHPQLARQLPQPFEGSEWRTILMRINDISVDDVLTLDGVRKVCRISGPLFCTVPDPQYTADSSGSHMLSPPETSAIPCVKNGNHFPFPIPPLGFQYKALTAEHQEVVLDANMIAGRYYPRLILSDALDMEWIMANKQAWWFRITAMSGLALSENARSNVQHLMRERAEAAETSEAAAISDFSSLLGTGAD